MSAEKIVANHLAPGIYPVRAFSDNYIWLLTNGHTAAVVDPGQSAPVLDTLKRHNLKLVSILLTHHHQDHVGGVSELVAHSGAHVFGPASEVLPVCDTPLQEGNTIEDTSLGLRLSVLDVPGHTAGHIAYAGTFEGAPVLFCGDTLFAAGCGRLFEGTPAQMDTSMGKLAALPPNTRVYCAHEYTLSNMRWARAVEPDNQVLARWQEAAQKTRDQDEPTLPGTIAQELACNPFMRARQPTVAQAAAQWAQRTLASPVEVFAALREWKNNFR